MLFEKCYNFGDGTFSICVFRFLLFCLFFSHSRGTTFDSLANCTKYTEAYKWVCFDLILFDWNSCRNIGHTREKWEKSQNEIRFGNTCKMACPKGASPLPHLTSRQLGNSFWNFRQNLYRERLGIAKNLYKKDLIAHYGCVNALEFSIDGNLLVSGKCPQHAANQFWFRPLVRHLNRIRNEKSIFVAITFFTNANCELNIYRVSKWHLYPIYINIEPEQYLNVDKIPRIVDSCSPINASMTKWLVFCVMRLKIDWIFLIVFFSPSASSSSSCSSIFTLFCFVFWSNRRWWSPCTTVETGRIHSWHFGTSCHEKSTLQQCLLFGIQ